MDLETLLGSTRAQTLTAAVISCTREAYAENAARFIEELGDNNMTFATCVVHNLRHLLEEALTDEPGIRIERPDGSFQVHVGRTVLHFYKGRPGPAETIEIRFDESRTKRSLIRHNANQLQLFEDDVQLTSGSTHLVFVHAGDHTDGLRAVWVGAPVLSGFNGFRWAWYQQIHGKGELAMTEGEGRSGRPENPWIEESDLPDLVIELRDDPEEDESVAEAP